MFMNVPLCVRVSYEVHIKGVPTINLLKSLEDAPIINFLSVPFAAFLVEAH